MIINVQCTSCHTRYRIDESVLPEGTPTFKCSRCNHVFSLEPRETDPSEWPAADDPALNPAVDTPAERNAAAAASETSPQPEPLAQPAASVLPAAKPLPDEGRAEDQPPTDELLNKLMRATLNEPAEGENLVFDFSDEPAPSDGPARDKPGADKLFAVATVPAAKKKPIRWQVGDDPGMPDSPRRAEGFHIGSAALDPVEDADIPDDAAVEEEFVDETRAPIYNRGIVHSSRFFLTLLMLVAAGFAITAATIHNAPAAALGALSQFPLLGDHFAQPLVPARMVALRNVSATYQSSKDGRPALVIQGEGENVSQTTLHTVQIRARLLEGGAAAGLEVYCGNNLTADIRQMTSHEIEFFQKQPPPPDFSLDPAASSPFVIVFLDPPAQARSFDLAVTMAQSPDVAASAPPES